MSTKELFAKRYVFLWAVGTSLFWVIFLWGFWMKGAYALGFNATVFWLLMLGFFAYANRPVSLFLRKNLSWVIPFLAMALSFSLYQNPWLNMITAGILPIAYAGFVNYAALKNRDKHIWNLHFMNGILERVFQVLENLEDSCRFFFCFLFPGSEKARYIMKRVLLGLGIFSLVAVIFVIPLLASADPVFRGIVDMVNMYLWNFISLEMVIRILTFIVGSFVFLSLFVSWKKSFELPLKKVDRKRDSIIAGIILSGILGIYVLFLSIQLGHLWINELPSEFSEAESLVKNGFWQLFTLSGLNVVLFFLYYRNTHPFVQKILVVFMLASILLLLSAAQRMFLYVTFYGFSYEKFFAAYTVLYSVLLFGALMVFLFQKRTADIFKFLILTFLWMYAFSTVLPVERIIFKSNMALSDLEDSRIELNELKMLSTDVLDLVEYHGSDPVWEAEWSSWINHRSGLLDKKQWYEQNVSNYIFPPMNPMRSTTRDE